MAAAGLNRIRTYLPALQASDIPGLMARFMRRRHDDGSDGQADYRSNDPGRWAPLVWCSWFLGIALVVVIPFLIIFNEGQYVHTMAAIDKTRKGIVQVCDDRCTHCDFDSVLELDSQRVRPLRNRDTVFVNCPIKGLQTVDAIVQEGFRPVELADALRSNDEAARYRWRVEMYQDVYKPGTHRSPDLVEFKQGKYADNPPAYCSDSDALDEIIHGDGYPELGTDRCHPSVARNDWGEAKKDWAARKDGNSGVAHLKAHADGPLHPPPSKSQSMQQHRQLPKQQMHQERQAKMLEDPSSPLRHRQDPFESARVSMQGQSSKLEDPSSQLKQRQDPFAAGRATQQKQSSKLEDPSNQLKQRQDPFAAARATQQKQSSKLEDPSSQLKQRQDPFAAARATQQKQSSKLEDPSSQLKQRQDPFAAARANQLRQKQDAFEAAPVRGRPLQPKQLQPMQSDEKKLDRGGLADLRGGRWAQTPPKVGPKVLGPKKGQGPTLGVFEEEYSDSDGRNEINDDTLYSFLARRLDSWLKADTEKPQEEEIGTMMSQSLANPQAASMPLVQNAGAQQGTSAMQSLAIPESSSTSLVHRAGRRQGSSAVQRAHPHPKSRPRAIHVDCKVSFCHVKREWRAELFPRPQQWPRLPILPRGNMLSYADPPASNLESLGSQQADFSEYVKLGPLHKARKGGGGSFGIRKIADEVGLFDSYVPVHLSPLEPRHERFGHNQERLLRQYIHLGKKDRPVKVNISELDRSDVMWTAANSAVGGTCGQGCICGSRSSNRDVVGDLRVCLERSETQRVSIIAGVSWDPRYGWELIGSEHLKARRASLYAGSGIRAEPNKDVTADEMFESAEQEASRMVWCLRLALPLMLWIGFYLSLSPLTFVLGRIGGLIQQIPYVGGTVALVLGYLATVAASFVGCVSCLLTASVSFFVVSVAWLWYRPLAAAILLGLSVVLALGLACTGTFEQFKAMPAASSRERAPGSCRQYTIELGPREQLQTEPRCVEIPAVNAVAMPMAAGKPSPQMRLM